MNPGKNDELDEAKRIKSASKLKLTLRLDQGGSDLTSFKTGTKSLTCS